MCGIMVDFELLINYCLFQFFAVELMKTQQVSYSQHNILFTIDAEDPVTICQVEIPFVICEDLVDMRFEFLHLAFCLHRSFENVDHFLSFKTASSLSPT